MKIFILTEGNQRVGFGHISRCTSLYQAFEVRGFKPEFIVNGDDTTKELLKGKSHKVFNWEAEQEKLFGLIEDADIVIIDSYLAGHELYKKISKLVKTPVYMDDNIRIDYPEGIVVNGTVFAERFNYPEKEEVAYLCGSRYAPLRKAFWDVPKREIKENTETVMITFGGDDVKKMTPNILGLITANSPELAKKVIVGKGFQNIWEIEKLKDSKTELIYFPDAEGMKKAMLESDVAISAGGQTLYELARVGVPTIAVAVVDNQMNNIRGWLEAGFIEYAGWWNDKDTISNVNLYLENLKQKDIRSLKYKNGRKIVDGRGSMRIVRKCISATLAEDIIVREVLSKDVYEVYNLSNEREVREISFDSSRISLEDHKKWFVQKMEDEKSLFLVAESRGNFIGQVRFDIIESEAVVSISLKKEYRGFGIGKPVLRRAITYLRAHTRNVIVIKAYIMKNNFASQGFFGDIGFRYSRELIIKGQHAHEFLYSI